MSAHHPRQPLHCSLLNLAMWAVLGCLLTMSTVSTTASAQSAASTSAHDHDHDHDHNHDHGHEHDQEHDHGHEPGRHVHGEITINLVLEGEQLVAELDAPAIHVVGFERAAKNDAERERVASAQNWLASGRNLLGVPRTAACRPANQQFTPPAADAKHANYRAQHTYQCANPSALAWVELWALRQLEGVEKIVVNLIIDGRQEQVVVDGQTQRIALR